MKNGTKRGQRKGRPYTPKPKQFRVLARHAAGHSDRRIAREEGISRRTVYRIRSQSENAMLLQSFREMILDIVPDAIKGLAKLVKERDRQAIIETLKGSRVLIDRHEVEQIQPPVQDYSYSRVLFFGKYKRWPTDEEAIKFAKTIPVKPTVKGTDRMIQQQRHRLVFYGARGFAQRLLSHRNPRAENEHTAKHSKT